ncbi:MAG: hypothetical protein ABUL72_04210, partial [Armatimonadota bacterium]
MQSTLKKVSTQDKSGGLSVTPNSLKALVFALITLPVLASSGCSSSTPAAETKKDEAPAASSTPTA